MIRRLTVPVSTPRGPFDAGRQTNRRAKDRISRLRRGDLANLWAEGPGMPSQIALLAQLDATPFLDPAGRFDGERASAELARRTWRVPALAQRIVWTRPGEGPPAWARDPAYAPGAHIESVRLPDGEDLARWAGNRAVQPLDRTRPLWRADIVAGLPDRRFGLLLVVHHTVADGLAGVAIAARLLDPEPAAQAPASSDDPPPPLPSHYALISDNLRARSASLAAGARRLPRAPALLRRGVRQLRDTAGDVRTAAPATSLPGRVGPRRHLTARTVPLAELHVAGHALAATVNDMLLAAVAGGLRDLLEKRGEDVTGLTLRASFPVGELPGQAAGMLLVGLPVGEPDPLRRLTTITRETTAAKTRIRTGGGDVFDVLRLPAPLSRLVVRWMRKAARRHINLFVTNVPGPTRPLWLAGARLIHAAPIAPLTADVPLGVAALSYAGALTVTVNADAAVTDIDVMADGVQHSLTALVHTAARS